MSKKTQVIYEKIGLKKASTFGYSNERMRSLKGAYFKEGVLKTVRYFTADCLGYYLEALILLLKIRQISSSLLDLTKRMFQ